MSTIFYDESMGDMDIIFAGMSLLSDSKSQSLCNTRKLIDPSGGGTAACVAAGRIAKANPDLKILLIEGRFYQIFTNEEANYLPKVDRITSTILSLQRQQCISRIWPQIPARRCSTNPGLLRISMTEKLLSPWAVLLAVVLRSTL